MRESYLCPNNSNSKIAGDSDYHYLDSYIEKENDKCEVFAYGVLPEEYSIFSKIDSSYFTKNDTAQHRFLAVCLQYLKKKLLWAVKRYEVTQVLPKLSITFDEDDAIILNWAYVNYRIYFSFEKKIENSYYGIVAQAAEERTSIDTGRLTEKNFSAIFDMVLNYVFENS